MVSQCAFAADAPCSLYLRLGHRLSTGRTWRDVSRQATLPRVDAFAFFKARQRAPDHRAGGRKGIESFPHDCQRHTGLFGDLEIESLTVFLQAIENFDHDALLRHGIQQQHAPRG